LVPLDARVLGEDSVLLEVATTTSHIRIAEAARTRVFAGDQPYPHTSRAITQLGFAARDLSFVMPRNEPIRIEKVVTIYTSRDRAIAAPDIAARDHLADLPGFAALLDSHVLAWDRLWR